jgi:hypothetical protein
MQIGISVRFQERDMKNNRKVIRTDNRSHIELQGELNSSLPGAALGGKSFQFRNIGESLRVGRNFQAHAITSAKK